jgi:hypothetical protein
MPLDIEWSAGLEGVRQTVYIDGNQSLVIMLNNEGIAIDLVEDGEIISSMWDTYADLSGRLDKERL